MKVVIISHTRHYKDNDKIVGWGPTIKELNYLSEICDELTHIAPLHAERMPNSSLSYNDKVKFVSLKPSGGKFFKKLSILSTSFFNLKQIIRHTKGADIIQFRAPTGIGVYVLPYLRFINKKKYWVKYAGNWVAKDLPLGNRLQRWWLKNMLESNTKVTVNGEWKNDKQNIVSFENPCLTEEDYNNGGQVIQTKNINEKINFCFVGALNKHKGVYLILEALNKLKDKSKIGTFHFVGDGAERNIFESMTKNIDVHIVFHGFLNKDKINTIYTQSHFVVLPSKSEGFPKVIGEGMNFGCVPIVSNVSAIGQYIKHGINGFLINPLSSENLSSIFKTTLRLDLDHYKQMQVDNHHIAKKFTYNYYIGRIKEEIF